MWVMLSLMLGTQLRISSYSYLNVSWCNTDLFSIQTLVYYVQLRIVVSREGTSGEATVTWSITPLMPTPISADDVTSLSGVISFTVGSSSAVIVIEILSDDESETEEGMTLTLDSVEPSDTQRLRANYTQVRLSL